MCECVCACTLTFTIPAYTCAHTHLHWLPRTRRAPHCGCAQGWSHLPVLSSVRSTRSLSVQTALSRFPRHVRSCRCLPMAGALSRLEGDKAFCLVSSGGVSGCKAGVSWCPVRQCGFDNCRQRQEESMGSRLPLHRRRMGSWSAAGVTAAAPGVAVRGRDSSSIGGPPSPHPWVLGDSVLALELQP